MYNENYNSNLIIVTHYDDMKYTLDLSHTENLLATGIEEKIKVQINKERNEIIDAIDDIQSINIKLNSQLSF